MLFTAADARALGISRGVLRGTQYRRVLGPLYVDGTVAITPRLQAEAALLLTPGAVVSDGRHHLVDSRQWRQDIRRRENLEREGWLVRVFAAYDLLHIPHTVVARISQDLHSRHPYLAA